MSSPPLMKPSSCFFLLLLLLICLHSFSGAASASARNLKVPNSAVFTHPEMKGGRKLIGVNGMLLDYEPPGANPAHDPTAPGRKVGKGG